VDKSLLDWTVYVTALVGWDCDLTANLLRIQQTNINDKFIEVIGKYDGDMVITEMISYVSLYSLRTLRYRLTRCRRSVDKIWAMNSVRDFFPLLLLPLHWLVLTRSLAMWQSSCLENAAHTQLTRRSSVLNRSIQWEHSSPSQWRSRRAFTSRRYSRATQLVRNRYLHHIHRHVFDLDPHLVHFPVDKEKVQKTRSYYLLKYHRTPSAFLSLSLFYTHSVCLSIIYTP